MSNLPLCRLALFSSGVGFFEHRGSVTGSAELSLPFHVDAINDALKSLVINDPAGSPVVSYPLEETLSRTLKSLSLDLRDSSVYDLLHNFRGAEIEILAPDSIRGRIIFVERRKEYVNSVNVNKDYLSLQTATGIKTICVDEISSFAFCDPQITADLNRALNLILQCRNNETRNIAIKLSGESERNVNLSYVIPTTLWKVSYRLDLSGEKPFLQGWAIIENDSDIDWENVELALVTGKPVSFIQKLYEIHKLSRPVIPLLIEGIAEAKMYDSGSANYSEKANKKTAAKFSELAMPGSMRSSDGFDALVCCEEAVGQFEEEDECDFAGGPKSGLVETADARAAGDQFEFKIKNSVNLARQQSAMLPLVEGEIKAEKILVFSKKTRNKITNPAICAELINNTGMKLPAGPVTIYDGGTYAGDALIKFLPEEEKRLITYGEDLSVTGSFTEDISIRASSIKIDNGVLFFDKKHISDTIYTFRNAEKKSKKLIIEHPIDPQAVLVDMADYGEKTHNFYRFTVTLPPTTDFFTFTVKEKRTIYERHKLMDIPSRMISEYIEDKRFYPKTLIKALQKTLDLKKKIFDAEIDLKNLLENRKKLVDNQERIRKNLEAAGNQTQQGKEYLQRMIKEDAAIDDLDEKVASLEKSIEKEKREYEEYFNNMVIK